MRYFFIIVFIVISALQTRAQQIKNLHDFDEHIMHFGFVLGYNKADMYVDRNTSRTFKQDSLLSLVVVPRNGFNLGIISSLNLNPKFHIRFVPTLSFQERWLNYTFATEPDTTTLWTKKIDNVYLDFPLLLKFRTERVNNFATYFITGMRYGLDMSSNKDVKNSATGLQDQVVKQTKSDYGVEVGGGMDFFLQYFKFGIELKLGVGLKNTLIQENLKFSSPLESLRTKTWTLSFTFEG